MAVFLSTTAVFLKVAILLSSIAFFLKVKIISSQLLQLPFCCVFEWVRGGSSYECKWKIAVNAYNVIGMDVSSWQNL